MTTRAIFLVLAMSLLLAIPTAAQQKDAPGCKDSPLFPVRMPKYRIEKCETKPFASYDFFTTKGPKRTVEGELTFIQYTVDESADSRSGLEVVRNYENALTKIGGKIQASDPQRWVNGFVIIGGKEVWAQAERGNSKIWLRIVKRTAMEQTIVADAASFSNDLKATGHVAVDGIYFDTNSAALKAESAAALAEIAKLLKADPSLKVYVVGHTDAVGNVDTNLKLSRDRADAVIQALVAEHAIAPARLRSFGNGPFAPVASNGTDEGRAKNRRVELVKQ
ncbi:MAG TPA: OmpA family protein [Thermoanaerobaculia bacterium]|nr:OmpA family protein [Thermoanaerobaculia bacterium]